MAIISPEKTQCYPEGHNQSAPPGFFVKGLGNGDNHNSILTESKLQSEYIQKNRKLETYDMGKGKRTII